MPIDPVLDVIRRAHILIRSGTAWCQDAEALNADGEDREGLDPDACQWCGYGATLAANPHRHIAVGGRIDHPRHVDVIADDYLDRAARALYSRHPTFAGYESGPTADVVNDVLGHTEILNVFDLAERLRRADLKVTA